MALTNTYTLTTLPKEVLHEIASHLPFDGHSLINLFAALNIPLTQANARPFIDRCYLRIKDSSYSHFLPDSFKKAIPYSANNNDKPECLKLLVDTMREIEYVELKDNDVPQSLKARIATGAHPCNLAVSLCKQLPNLYKLSSADNALLHFEEIVPRLPAKLIPCLEVLLEEYQAPFIPVFSDLHKKIELVASEHTSLSLRELLKRITIVDENQLRSLHYQNFLDDFIANEYEDAMPEIRARIFSRLSSYTESPKLCFKTTNQNIADIKKMLTELVLMQDDHAFEDLMVDDFHTCDNNVQLVIFLALFYCQFEPSVDLSRDPMLKAVVEKIKLIPVSIEDQLEHYEKVLYLGDHIRIKEHLKEQFSIDIDSSMDTSIASEQASKRELLDHEDEPSAKRFHLDDKS